jgi:KipI family sensor histidine kinase inhibitor
MGERAVLAEVVDLAAVLSLHAALAENPPLGVDDLVPAARTVLVAFDPALVSREVVRAWILGAARQAPDADSSGPLVEVPVRYDGADLASTAELLGIPVSELVSRHEGVEWTVAFTGFAPGFAYLVSAAWPFDVPRLAEPRTRVPAGAVGLAGGFSGAYPRETPGGWRLIGTTDAVLFDPDAASPVLLPPRARVRFVAAPSGPGSGSGGGRGASAGGATGASPSLRPSPFPHPAPEAGPARAAGASASAAPRRGDPMTGVPEPAGRRRGAGPGDPLRTEAATADSPPALRVLVPGGLATVQDLGRPGRAGLGVARAGALDRAALRIANRLVGNDEDAAGLEIALGGFCARAVVDTWVCVTGALVEVRVDGRACDAYAPVRVAAGSELSIDGVRGGARNYVAVRGGIAAPAVMGSRSRDGLAGLGPRPLRADDVVRVGPPSRPIPTVDFFPWSVPPAAVDVRVSAGPRADWFAPATLTALIETAWTVSSDADRVGIRLDGPALGRLRGGELPSEGMRPGAIQVPPHGRPVVLLADGPVTGGYPVLAVVMDADLDTLAQVRPGDGVRFRRV